MPRDFWLLEWEKKAITSFHSQYPLNGYRRLTFMMLDQNIVAISPKTTYRVLKDAGVMDKKNLKTSKKGTGFCQPERPHQHWHIDVSYINLGGTFYYLCSILDGYSRVIVHWDIKEAMKEEDIELILQKAREKYPGTSTRIISDNGPQFVSRDFKNFVRLAGMDHVRTSPYYPQSNGKIERWHKELKEQCIRAHHISTLDEARQRTASFVEEYNNHRLHASIGYIAPIDKLMGREEEIFRSRDSKLAKARASRAAARQTIKKDLELSISEKSAGGYGNAEEHPERHADRGEQILPRVS